MKEKIILKSTHPEEYPDLEIECRVILNDKIGEYLDNIPAEKKFYAHKNGRVEAREGIPGETIKTQLLVTVNGKEYIFHEEENVVKQREYNGALKSDIVVKNIDSTSNEEYIVKYQKFCDTYTPVSDQSNTKLVFEPVIDSRLLTQVDENVIIMTAWGAPAVCLTGSYIVTYNANENDYNTIEQGAFKSTYIIDDSKEFTRRK